MIYIPNPNFLQHYASPYYDPVKAHEYYMKHRQLKGRSGLNDAGKQAADYIKSQIHAERDAKIAERKTRYANDKHTASETKDNNISSISKAAKEQISSNNAAVQSSIKSLRSELNSLTSAQKRARRAEYTKKIAELRNENAKTRAAIRQEALGDKEAVRADYSEKSNNLREGYKSDVASYREEATNKYNAELEKLHNAAEFKAVKKGKNGSSKKGSSTTRSRRSRTKRAVTGQQKEQAEALLQRYHAKHG